MSEAVLGPKSAKYRVFCGYTWKTPVYLENTWVSCRFPQFCPRFCPRPALRLRETREFPEGNSRETEWSTKHPLVSLETSGNAKCWGPSGFPLGCRKPLHRPKAHKDSKPAYTEKMAKKEADSAAPGTREVCCRTSCSEGAGRGVPRGGPHSFLRIAATLRIAGRATRGMPRAPDPGARNESARRGRSCGPMGRSGADYGPPADAWRRGAARRPAAQSPNERSS